MSGLCLFFIYNTGHIQIYMEIFYPLFPAVARLHEYLIFTIENNNG